MTVKTYYKRASANDFHTVLRLIDNGKWLNERPYHVIHRVARLPHHHGGMNDLTDWYFSKESNILIDTLSDNTVMHRLTKTAELIAASFICKTETNGRHIRNQKLSENEMVS